VGAIALRATLAEEVLKGRLSFWEGPRELRQIPVGVEERMGA